MNNQICYKYPTGELFAVEFESQELLEAYQRPTLDEFISQGWLAKIKNESVYNLKDAIIWNCGQSGVIVWFKGSRLIREYMSIDDLIIELID